MKNSISEVTRRNIFDELRLCDVNWSGRLAEDEFLSRIFDLSDLPSNDHRCPNMASDIFMHRQNFLDWSDDWVFDDSRLNLLRCEDETFLLFLCEMVSPIVRQDEKARDQLLTLFNKHLAVDGYEIAPHRYISGRPVFAARERFHGVADVPVAAKEAVDVLESNHIAMQVTRMEASVQSDPPLAIGTAKEFLETICKGILAERDVLLNGTENMPKLVKLTRDSLGIEDVDPNSAVKKVISGLANAAQGVAELRGKMGTGHGPHPQAAMAQPELARLIVGASVTTGVFLLEMHRKSQEGHGI